MSNIIDISHHQDPSKIDYDKLAKEVDLAIIRTQYGSRTLDRHYKKHHAEFKKRGVPTAAYAWVRGTSIKDMEVEATDFYNRTKDLDPVFWFLDVEEKSMDNMRAGVSAYVNKLRQLGAKKVGIYIAHHLYKSFNLNLDEVEAIWIPHYGTNTGKIASTPSYKCDLHQYTSVGKLNGYGGNLDLNRLMNKLSLEFFIGAKESPKPKKPTIEDAQKSLNSVLGKKIIPLVLDGSPGPLTRAAAKLVPLIYYKENVAVKWVQEVLKYLGFYRGDIDGKYGPITRDAVSDFQKRYNLLIDGKTGPQTWGKLFDLMK